MNSIQSFMYFCISGYGCMRLGTVIHEMLHAAGFWHEQSRPDRNENVRIHWQNILSGYDDNFARYSRAEVTTLSLPYDTGSVMHYESTAFTKNGKPTIQSLKAYKKLGQRDGLSQLDIQKLNKLYSCGDKITKPPTEVKCVDVYTNGNVILLTMKFDGIFIDITNQMDFHHLIINASLLKAGATLGVEEVVANDTRPL